MHKFAWSLSNSSLETPSTRIHLLQLNHITFTTSRVPPNTMAVVNYWSTPDSFAFLSSYGSGKLIKYIQETSHLDWSADECLTLLRRPQRTRLLDLAVRIKCGHLVYEKYDFEELKSFAEARGIDTLHYRKKWAFVKALEHADDTVAFPKFMQLPLEIRAGIYAYYFDADPAFVSPLLPSLALVSHQVRQEILPVFFRTCRFTIILEVGIDLGKAKVVCHPASAALISFARLTAREFGGINKLQLSVVDRNLPLVDDGIRINITISPSTNDYTIETFCIFAARRNYELSFEMYKAVHGVIAGIAARSGPSKLRKWDLTAIAGCLDREL